MPPPRATSDSESPTQSRLMEERVALLERLRHLQEAGRRDLAGAEPGRDEFARLRQVTLEATIELARAQVVLDMTIDVLRAFTEQQVHANKIAAREWRLRKEQADTERAGTRRVDLVVGTAVDVVKKAVADQRVWTVIATSVMWAAATWGRAASSAVGCVWPGE